MATLDTRINRLADPDMPPVNPLLYLAVELALAHPDHARLQAAVVEANRTGRLPADPLHRALARLIAASVAADEAGLFASDYGERLYQRTDAECARNTRLEAMSPAEADAYLAQERTMRQTLLEVLREHLDEVADSAVKHPKGVNPDGD